MANDTRKCFVIMPFNEKVDVDGKVLDFDRLYRSLIREAVEGKPMRDCGGPVIECIRCDEIDESGWVHRQMISHILTDDVAVVDLSTLNPNVFYELGVRHALRQCVTVLLRRKGTKTPFNLQGFKSIDYDPDEPVSLAEARAQIARYVANGLNGQIMDSLVHEVLKERQLMTVPAERINPESVQLFKIRGAPRKRIGLMTGDLRTITDVDVWVNSENTNMQMARYYDRSGSAVIRYFGAKRDAGQVVEDTIADELTKALGGAKSVPPGTVLVTSSGELLESNRVKKIFHAAAVQGQPGVGYKPIPDVEMCVREALAMADAKDWEGVELRSILFPVMGTGSGGGELRQTFRRLLGSAISYFETRPDSVISTAYFLAFTDQQRDACQAVLAQADLERVTSRRPAKRVTGRRVAD